MRLPAELPPRSLWIWQSRDETQLLDTARKALKDFAPERVLRCGDDGQALSAARTRHWLGQDADAVWLHAWQGLCPNTLAIAGGCLRAGGVFLLTTPPLARWENIPQATTARYLPYPLTLNALTPHYLRRCIHLLRNDPELASARTINLDTTAAPTFPNMPPAGPAQAIQANTEQLAAISTLIRSAIGQRRKPTLLTADRGRGKSTALGMAAAQLIKQKYGAEIIVTAAHVRHTYTLFQHAAQALGEVYSDSEHPLPQLNHPNGRIRFMPPDQLLNERPHTDFLLVDEAAGLPTHQLTALAQHYSRLAFATTLHGYEGAGRGFALKFRHALKKASRSVREITLTTPIRWGKNDPLETALNRWLILDADLAESPESLCGDPFEYAQLDPAVLSRDEALLRTVFGLLIDAHYRSQPSDVQALLDNPQLQLWVMRRHDQILAVAIISLEGGLDEACATRIYRNQARPRGHLLPEVLAAQAGLNIAPTLHYARIQRIVVHPDHQQHGLGSQFIQHLIHVTSDESEPDIDLIGTHFGADAQLSRFWRKNSLTPVHLGEKPNAASGLSAATFLHPLSESGKRLMAAASRRYATGFLHQIDHSYQHYDPTLMHALAPKLDAPSPSPLQNRELDEFIHGNRPFKSCLPSLHQLLCYTLAHPDSAAPLDSSQYSLLIRCIWQRQPLQSVCETLELSHRELLLQQLRDATQRLMQNHL